MIQPGKKKEMSRRLMLGSMAMAAAGTLGMTAGMTLAPESKTATPPKVTVRDRLWIFTVHEGSNNDALEVANVRGGSRMTPAEGAFWLGVSNLLFVREHEIPILPISQRWRAKTSFEQYAISFQPLNRVVWSVVGSSGSGGMNVLPHVISLAKEFPNIAGVYFDDFFTHRSEIRPDGRKVYVPPLRPDEIKRVRDQLNEVGRPLETWVTLYTHNVNSARKIASPPFKYSDPPLASYLGLFDVLTYWTWNSDELPYLEENLAALEKIAPKGARIALGLYLFDYLNKKAVPLDLMEHQCELGLKWLKTGRIHDMIFLANTVLDVGLPSAEFSRQWIKKVGSQSI